MEGVDNTHLFDLLWILDFFLLHVLLREFCAPSTSLYSQLILVLVFSFLAYLHIRVCVCVRVGAYERKVQGKRVFFLVSMSVPRTRPRVEMLICLSYV